MTDRPVIFSAPMILALLREAKEQGTGKSQTRRLAWNKPKLDHVSISTGGNVSVATAAKALPWQRVQPGDRLWVKEAVGFTVDHFSFFYEADKACLSDHKIQLLRQREIERGKPYANLGGRYVPKFTSRLTLVVTATKIERLHDISEQDCEREGCVWTPTMQWWEVSDANLPSGAPIANARARDAFACLWDTVNGSGAWAQNPEVVALTFAVHARNIDSMEKAA